MKEMGIKERQNRKASASMCLRVVTSIDLAWQLGSSELCIAESPAYANLRCSPWLEMGQVKEDQEGFSPPTLSLASSTLLTLVGED